MRALQVVHQFLPEYVGGTEVYVDALARHLSVRGNEVRILAGGDGYSEHVWKGMKVHIVPGGLRGERGVVGNFLTAFGNSGVERAFEKLCLEYAPDLVHFHHFVGLSSRLVYKARALNIPTAFTLHDYWFLCPNGQLITERQKPCNGPILGINCGVCAAHRVGLPAMSIFSPVAAPMFLQRQSALRKAVSEVDIIIAPSKFIGNIAAKNGLPADKIVYIEHGIEMAPKSGYDVAEDEGVRFVYLGSIAPVKGVHLLVEAYKRLNNDKASLLIYGDLSAFPDYSRQIQRDALGSGIKFMGRAEREQVPEVLQAADVLVVPSLWYENAPLVVQEAFAMGVPVVVSRTGALEEWVVDGVNGLHFSPNDASDLADKLKLLIDRPELLSTLKSNSPRVPTMSEHVNQIERVYQSLIAARVD